MSLIALALASLPAHADAAYAPEECLGPQPVAIVPDLGQEDVPVNTPVLVQMYGTCGEGEWSLSLDSAAGSTETELVAQRWGGDGAVFEWRVPEGLEEDTAYRLRLVPVSDTGAVVETDFVTGSGRVAGVTEAPTIGSHDVRAFGEAGSVFVRLVVDVEPGFDPDGLSELHLVVVGGEASSSPVLAGQEAEVSVSAEVWVDEIPADLCFTVVQTDALGQVFESDQACLSVDGVEEGGDAELPFGCSTVAGGAPALAGLLFALAAAFGRRRR